MEILQRKFIYVWYYFDIQFRQVFRYWVLGMAIGSAVSVLGKDKVHAAFLPLGTGSPVSPGCFWQAFWGLLPRFVCMGQSPLRRLFHRKA